METVISRFFANADHFGSTPIFRFNTGGQWVPMGWRTAAGLASDFASGLMSMGHEKGDSLSIISQTRWEWAICDLGTLAAGGITVGVYPTMTADQSRYIVAHSDSRFVVVEDKKQLAKIESVRSQLPRIEKIIIIDPAGVSLGGEKMSLSEVLSKGRAAKHDPMERVAKLRLEDAATFVYTSGTTGPPKGAMLTHGNLMAELHSVDRVLQVKEDDTGFIFLPLAHVLQKIVSYHGFWKGIPGSFARSLDTVAEDMAACRPSIVAAVPRIFEKVYARVHDQAAAGPALRKKIFDWAVKTGLGVSHLRQAHESVPRRMEIEHALGSKLVFQKLRDRLGGRVRLFITGGAPIAKDILSFFDAAGITILEGWGMTETCGAASLNLPGASRFGSIGKPLPDVDMRLDDDGEILIRGPMVFSGYYKDEEATKGSFTADGYFRTGDIARKDADGYYFIIDRKKDLIITAAGKNVAPQNIENMVKTDPRISQVVVIGDRRPYLTALVAVTPELRSSRSEADLVAMVQEIVNNKNQEMASYERIKKIRLLPGELTQEAGELTPTLKVKRKIVNDRYGSLIEEMYSEPKAAQGVATGAG
ncbi:MAG: long-chain fatty acid--CoA ligase [Deltaproteobacteria bacterium]|nr:long-chain fatty acid--CoA ligase [Deltaproteobacteria bacterium]